MKKNCIKRKISVPLFLISSLALSPNAHASEKISTIEIESLEITVDTSPFVFDGDSFEELELEDRERLISSFDLDDTIDDILNEDI